MTVKDIFALRKQGKIEEAYEAIRPIYREHKGHYTTICMFACGSDMYRLRGQQGRFYEATKIYAALKRMLPMLDDKDGRAAGFLHYAGSQLGRMRRERAAAHSGSPASSVPSGSPAISVLSGSPTEALNKGQQAVLECIKAYPGLKVPGIDNETGIPAKSIERHIKVLIERNLIEHRGSKKTGGYHAL